MLLLDTQIVIWLAGDQSRLSSRVSGALRAARVSREGLAIAAITLWELAMLATRKKIRFDPPVEVFLEKVERFYEVLPLNRSIALRGQQFSKNYPKDPADRQIGATALLHGMNLVTSDEKIRDSGEVPCLW